MQTSSSSAQPSPSLHRHGPHHVLIDVDCARITVLALVSDGGGTPGRQNQLEVPFVAGACMSGPRTC
eukprot:38535-Eustigmatos_ZCMA.PRE.1